MPAISLGVGTLIAGLASGGAAVAGSAMASRAAGKAGKQQLAANAEALDFAKKQDALDRANYMEERDYARELYGDRLGRLKPYMDAGEQSVNSLASLLRPNPNVPTSAFMVPDGRSAADLAVSKKPA